MFCFALLSVPMSLYFFPDLLCHPRLLTEKEGTTSNNLCNQATMSSRGNAFIMLTSSVALPFPELHSRIWMRVDVLLA